VAEDDILPGPLDLQGVRFYVAGFRATRDCVGAGAILGNADRVMDRLSDQVKRRGPTLSSRTAASFLGGSAAAAPAAATFPGNGAPARVADALCRLEGGTHAFLYSSGMSAITRVLDLLRSPEKPNIVAVGHLYNDTYQTLRLGPNTFVGVDELDALEGLVSGTTAAILTETITNPLSDVPDLDLLSRVARSRGIPLVVDNTIATPANCHPFEHGADFVIHSTTKYLNGANDHAGGAVIVRDPLLGKRLGDFQLLLNDQMSPLEALALERNLASFTQRMSQFNENARKVAEFLAGHRGVERVFFNSLPSHRSFATARRLLRGPGSVISFTLVKATWERLRAFYDSELRGIVKAPSLGSDVTLLCPYTLLTHYDDTDEELAEIGLPRFLLRVSVGCEDSVDQVLDSLDRALASSMEASQRP
jgi:cystathionine gamma-lyase / homocysteine desulfhydrase